ncbi:amidohydrolase [Christensenellaceae bacterium OttesenSCG-928-M15]|nr:amidohydrolase [Christensenellaceae bacterium OttesenSCG-928-M15]
MAVADLVLFNGKICTLDPLFRFYEAVAVKDGYIIDLGSTSDMRRHIGKKTEVVDLMGKLLLPGAHDEHCHAAYAGLYWRPGFVDTYGFTSFSQFEQAIKNAVSTTKNGEWIMGGGMNRSLAGKPLTRHDIDSLSPNHPVMINDSGLHGLLLNSYALKLCGIDRHTPDIDPNIGKIERDESGEPTGFFVDFAAQSAVMKNVAPFMDEEMESCILRAQAALNCAGITTHTDIAGPGGDHLFCGTWGMPAVEAYARLLEKGKLTARCAFNIFPGLEGVQSYDAITGGLDALKLPDLGDGTWLRADALKFFGDLGWRRPEEARAGRLGHCTFSGVDEEAQAAHLTRTIIEAHRRNWQIGIHLTGGKGIDYTIAAFIKAQQEYPGPLKRHFIIHADEMSAENIADCAKHGIMLSTQAIAPYSFMEEVVDALRDGLGEDLFDYKTYLQAGIFVSQGSDAPTMPHTWLKGLQFMLTRTTKSGATFRKDLKCTIEQGLRMYTLHGAYQNHMERLTGSVEIGKLADFQVLEEDVFKTNPAEVGDIPVVMTVVGGNIVYDQFR